MSFEGKLCAGSVAERVRLSMKVCAYVYAWLLKENAQALPSMDGWMRIKKSTCSLAIIFLIEFVVVHSCSYTQYFGQNLMEGSYCT